VTLVGLSDDQEFFRQTTERFLAELVPPDTIRALRGDPAGFDPSYWRRGAELGWTSLLVDEERGGGTISGQGLVDLRLVAYEFGHHAAPGPLAVTNVVAAALGQQPTADEVLAALLSGEAVASWCMPVVTPDGWRPTVTAAGEGSGLVLHGTSRHVESAAQAGHLLVTCQDGDGTTQVLVPTSAPGLTITPMQTVELTRRFFVVDFDGVRVDSGATVGVRGGSADDVERQLQQYLVVLNAESVGAMQAGFDMTVEWAFDRYTFGRPLASYQALKHRFADMLSWLEGSHAISALSCAAAQQGRPDAPELVSAAKAYIGQYGAALLQDCVQLHGGIGVTFEHDLHLFLRRVTVDRALGGTPAVHRQRIAVLLDEQEGAAA
jgi:alkylation response protein AidB-like acyl-CoA dehydrogenase